MKYLILLLLILPLSFYGQADSTSTPQPKKMFHGVEKGGYFGINIGATVIDSVVGGSIGMRFMSVTNRWFSYGLILNGQFSGEIIIDDASVKYLGGNGGFQINPILFPRLVMHISFPMAFGVGWLGEYAQTTQGRDFTRGEFYYAYFEPGIELEFNMAHKIRMSFAIMYTERFSIKGLTTVEPDIIPIVLQFNLKFGNFGFIDRY